ncbi:MAG: ABC transporter ATP-binding protein [Deltaproteobacteria bacterium]|nr:MAG: ABC transporter ATP-binding protein [Deltaproteobacteria bacterium]
MSIRVQKLRKRYDNHLAVDDVTFSVADGEFVTLLGPSGSGKSTILRCIAGLELPTDGTIEIDGNLVTHIPAQKRKVGFVFQHYALFVTWIFRKMLNLVSASGVLAKKNAPKKLANFWILLAYPVLKNVFQISSQGVSVNVSLSHVL